MKKLRHPRWLALFTVGATMALISAVPAGAFGEGTEAAGGTEPAPPAEAPSTPGWVPQGDPAEEGGEAAAPIQRGSSLGSGGGSNQSQTPAEDPAPAAPPAPVPVASDPSEPEAPSPSGFEEPASTRAVPAVAPEPPAAEPAPVGLGAADPVAKRRSPHDSARPASPVEAEPVAATSEQAATGSGLLWPTLIVGILILLYAGARLLLGPVELDVFRSSPFRRVRRGYPRV